MSNEAQCACVHPDRWMCMAIRYDTSYEEVVERGDECQCYCHVDEEGEDDGYESVELLRKVDMRLRQMHAVFRMEMDEFLR